MPMELTAAAHDRAVATISGLPLLASAALAGAATHSPGWAVGRELAAQGWQGATRLARGDPGLGAGILAANAGPVAEALRTYRAVLDAWQARLDLLALSDSASAEEVRLALEAARESLAAGEET
jgi:prephenate dehydrogenase